MVKNAMQSVLLGREGVARQERRGEVRSRYSIEAENDRRKRQVRSHDETRWEELIRSKRGLIREDGFNGASVLLQKSQRRRS